MAGHDEQITQIYELISFGKQKEAKRELSKLLKQGPFTDKEKLHISRWHNIFADIGRAIKVCGRELSEDQLKEGSIDQLVLQNYLGFLLFTIGARYSSIRILNKVDIVCEDKNITIAQYDPYDYFQKAHILRTSAYFEKAREVAQEGCEYYLKKGLRKEYLNTAIILADTLRALGQYDEVRKVLLEVEAKVESEKSALKAVYLRAKASEFMREGKFEEALKQLNRATEYKSLGQATPLSAILLAHMGECYFFLKDFDRSQDYFLQALKVHFATKTKSTVAKLSYYFLSQCPGFKLTYQRQLSLKCHHAYSSYSFLAGKIYNPAKNEKLDHLFEGRDLNYDKEVWLLQNGEVKALSYHEALEKAFNADQLIHDFYSGIKFSKGAQIQTIPETQLRCLAPIFGAGELGISKWALIDIIYREEEFCFDYGEERLKYLTSELKKRGYSISRKKNFYYYEHSEKEVAIFPMDLPQQRLHAFLKTQRDEFRREDVEGLFGVHKATANRWIKDWLDQGFITESKQNYLFHRL